jgi:hypothetical protein
MPNESGVSLNPTENIYYIATASDLPDELDEYRLYHLAYMGNTLWYYNGSELTPVSGNFWLEVAKGNVSGHSLVHKFGANSGIPNGSAEIVSSISAAGYGIFLAAATTVRVKAGGDANDTVAGTGARKVIISGINELLAEVTEEVDLAGASASSSTTTTFLRVHRAWVSEAGSGGRNDGIITIENTAGTQDLLQIDDTVGQTLHAVYSSPTGYDMYLLSVLMTVDSGKSVDFSLYKREQYDDVSAPIEAYRIQNYWNGITGEVVFKPNSPTLISQVPCDLWMEAYGNGGTGAVSADLEILLVANT